MWTPVLLPMLTMAIGFLMGIVCMDTFYDNKRINKLERELNRLKKRLEAME